jgi:hypothetical protein
MVGINPESEFDHESIGPERIFSVNHQGPMLIGGKSHRPSFSTGVVV